MSIKAENYNGVLSVILPPEYKEPYWLDFMYKNKYTKKEDGSIIIPCRMCNVTITKPVVQQSPMGMIQTQQSFIEQWYYFDVPQVSALVKEGEDLLESWSVDKLQLELKETQQIPAEEKHNEEVLEEKKDGV